MYWKSDTLMVPPSTRSFIPPSTRRDVSVPLSLLSRVAVNEPLARTATSAEEPPGTPMGDHMLASSRPAVGAGSGARSWPQLTAGQSSARERSLPPRDRRASPLGAAQLAALAQTHPPRQGERGVGEGVQPRNDDVFPDAGGRD